MRPQLFLFVLPACALAVLAGRPAAGQAAAPTAEAGRLLAAIGTREAALPPVRMRLQVRETSGRHASGEDLDATRKRLGGNPAVTLEGTLVAAPAGWIRDVASGSGASASRTRTAEVNGARRMLIETTAGGREVRMGLLSPAASITPGEAVLARRVARAAEGIRWTGSTERDGRLTLTGTRGSERHTLVLRRSDPPAVVSWTLDRKLQGPEGESVEQRYVCVVTSAAAGDQVEEFVINPPPLENVAYRTTRVRQVEPLEAAAVKPETFALRFPGGTLVRDARGDVPVEYEQTEAGVDEDQVAAFAAAQAEGRAKAGEPAPAFELKDHRGKRVRLADFKGKPLLLFWFASWSEPARAAAEALGKMSRDLQKAGLEILAIDVAEEQQKGDPEELAEAFRKQYRWNFPVALDEAGETQRRYGYEPAVPKVAVVDAHGKLLYVQAGFDPPAITAVLQRLLARPEAPKAASKPARKREPKQNARPAARRKK